MTASHTMPVPLGTPVLTADGNRVGDVVETASHFFVVEKGLLFTDELHIPVNAIATADADGIHLSLTDADVEGGDWALPPPPDVPAGRERAEARIGAVHGSMPRYVGAGMNGENGYDHHGLLKKP